MKDIKIKEKNISIKTKNNKDDLFFYIKRNLLYTKQSVTINEEESSHINTINNIEYNAKNNLYHISDRSKTLFKNKIQYSRFHNKKRYSSYEPKYIKQLKAYFLKNHQKSAPNKLVTKQKNNICNAPFTIMKFSLNVLKKTALSINNIIFYSSCFILLLVMILYIGAFSSLSNNTVFATTYTPLSKEVLDHTAIIEKYAKQYDIEDYIPLIQAIMMQESKGIGLDPMNSSSFKYNSGYPNVITDIENSIDVGIHYLADCLKAANVTSPNDTEKLYLAIQGYNYKIEYIYWALNNFDGYTKSNAQIYADQMRHNLNINVYGNPNYVNQVIQYLDISFGNVRLQPNFDNHMAWGNNNPYSRNNLYGQCTWFAWGRFYELYGFDPKFTGDGWDCAKQLVAAHPDKFKLSSTPQIGSVFSCIGRNHVGIVVGWDGKNITIQEGNLDGKTNTFYEAKKDWQTVTYDIDTFRNVCNGVVFAIYY